MIEKLKELIPYIIIIVVVILIRTFIITPVRVDGDSMKDNYHDGDILLLYKLSSLNRYDVIVLKEEDDIIIKRIIGLPNDRVDIKNGKIYVNEEEIDDCYANGETLETLSVTLKSDEYFVLGDNRMVSKDSRIFGPVNKEEIMGKVIFRLYPFNKIGIIKNKGCM